ncbi:Type IV pilus assembly protein PilB [Candidatus Magnetomoraceae bacterium gMMP-1]
MKIKRLIPMIIESGLLTEEEINQAVADQKSSGLELDKFLVQEGIITESDITDLISQELKISRYNPEDYPFELELTELVPLETAQKFMLVPLQKKGWLLIIAMINPMDIKAMDAIEEITGCEVESVICTEQELMQLTSSIYGMRSGNILVMEGIEDVEFDTKSDATSDHALKDVQVSSLQDMAEEAPVVRWVNSLLFEASRRGASDIHVSPEKNHVQIRLRIDGRLQEVPSPPKSMHLPIISRIKILANMDIATSMVPQDGRFTVKMENKEINVRASSIPTIYGENIVLRLLDMSSTIYDLNRLGMNLEDVDKVESVITKPYGMILSTGPTGSGKSTSLYSILQKINKPDINIITLEDPVEYRVEKIRQIQLNRKAGMTFASGLRSILRQDPDVIMVGEIRDPETAEIAVRSALTGHRVLSTVHTNDATGAITRLLEMGIEPFLVSSVLLVSFAQRLVRTVCPFCKEPYDPPEKALAYFGLNNVENALFQRGRGCVNCMGTGYRGRTAVFEVLIIDDMIREMILDRRSAQEIAKAAKKSGKLKELKNDAADKIAKGITTIEEAASSVAA